MVVDWCVCDGGCVGCDVGVGVDCWFVCVDVCDVGVCDGFLCWCDVFDVDG